MLNEQIKRPSVGIISIHSAPYRDEIFSILHRKGVVKIEVITLFSKDPDHEFENPEQIAYPISFLEKCWGHARNHSFHPQIISTLRNKRFDVIVIPGYYYATCWFAILYCIVTRTPFILTGDRILNENISTVTRTMKFIKAKVKCLILHAASAHWVPGKASREYLRNEGIDDRNIFVGCYNLDCAAIAEQVDRQRDKRAELRKSIAMNEDSFIFLMVANVLPNRQYNLLLKSFAKVISQCPDSYLLIVGKGAHDEWIEDLSMENKIKNVLALGPVGFAKLPVIFATVDAYVHSGGEPYSTAVAYAAIAQLPIVTTSRVGAASDYVIENETGFLVDSENISGFAEKMILLAQNKEKAKRLGRNARNLAIQHSAEFAAKEIEKAILGAICRENT